jgi:dienelactone hydrolase
VSEQVSVPGVTTQDVEYTLNGKLYIGQLCLPESISGPRPGVLVAHSGQGLNNHAKNRAQRVALLGYTAFALDYYGNGVPPAEGANQAEIAAMMGDVRQTRAIGRAGLEVLSAHESVDSSRLAAIGFCFGGTMVLELARDGADLKAVVGFHSGLTTSRPEDASNISGRILTCLGADDPIIPSEQRIAFEQEMTAGNVVDWQILLFGGALHGFTDEEGDGTYPFLKYDEIADRRSWAAMCGLFDEAFA